ncbi:MAG: ATP-binding cassette domain-containing protein [Burkholderiaceae bacterium]
MTTPAGPLPAGASPAPILRVSALCFGYPQQPLFDHWSHDFPAGLTWIEGDNGCGKSTLLDLLAGILAPTAGMRTLNGIDADRQPAQYRDAIARYAPAPPGEAPDGRDVQESARAMLRRVTGDGPDDADSPVGGWVAAMGLADFLDKPLAHLSKGSRRKVDLVAAILRPTAAIVLDEPLAALDLRSQSVVQACLAQAARQHRRIWIVASHEALTGAGDDVHRLRLPSVG